VVHLRAEGLHLRQGQGQYDHLPGGRAQVRNRLITQPPNLCQIPAGFFRIRLKVKIQINMTSKNETKLKIKKNNDLIRRISIFVFFEETTNIMFSSIVCCQKNTHFCIDMYTNAIYYKVHPWLNNKYRTHSWYF
jgi:hypothetical protein